MKWLKKHLVWVMLGGVVFLFLLNFSMIFFVSDKEIRGTFGDQFGAVNALFSGLAFAGLIYTIILQRRDLELQRNDLRLQREELVLNRQEMEEQTAEFEKQNATLLKQTFETTFFHMLELHKQNVQEINVQGIKGRDSMVLLIDILNRLYYSVCQGLDEIKESKGDKREELVRAYEIIKNWTIEKQNDFSIKFAYGLFFYGERFHLSYMKESESRIVENGVMYYKGDKIEENYGQFVGNVYKLQGFSSVLGHYYRHIYQTVCFVDSQENLTDDVKYSYVKMLRAQLSDYEQVLFYYNAMSSMGYPWIQAKGDDLPLIIKYRMIKNIPHFIRYIYNDPREEFKSEIEEWEKLHQGEQFFEQVKNLTGTVN